MALHKLVRMIPEPVKARMKASPSLVALNSAITQGFALGISEDKLMDPRFLALEHIMLNGHDFAEWTPTKAGAFTTVLMNQETFRFWQLAFGYLSSSGIEGDYHEFGCFSGRTFRVALSEAKRIGMEKMHFYAYDSFEGLPEPDPNAPPALECWEGGSMAMSDKDFKRMLDAHGVYRDKISIIKGFFDKTLTRELQQKMLDSGRKIGIANVDCDLYESAVPVFDFIEPLLQEGSLVYVDDYYVGYKGNPNKGAAGAFHEWEKRSQWKFHRHALAGWWGQAFIAYK